MKVNYEKIGRYAINGYAMVVVMFWVGLFGLLGFSAINKAYAGAGTELVQANGAKAKAVVRQFEDVRPPEPVYQLDELSPKFEITGIGFGNFELNGTTTIPIHGLIGKYDPSKIIIKSVTLDHNNRFVITFEHKGLVGNQVRAQVLDFNSPRFLTVVKAKLGQLFPDKKLNDPNFVIHAVNNVESLDFKEEPSSKATAHVSGYHFNGISRQWLPSPAAAK